MRKNRPDRLLLHPLEYKNVYQLIVMVVLSAQSNDAYINRQGVAFLASSTNWISRFSEVII